VTAARANGQISDTQAIAARELIDSGFTIIRNVVSGALCDQVVADFARYLRDHSKYAPRCVDAQGRRLRFVNFPAHHKPRSNWVTFRDPVVTRLLVCSVSRRLYIVVFRIRIAATDSPGLPVFSHLPDQLFLAGLVRARGYPHRLGTPHVCSRGASIFRVDHRAIFEEVSHENPHLSTKEILNHALQRYYSIVNAEANNVAPERSVVLSKGDCAIWHPMLPHGGKKAQDPMLTRKSMVFHCAPVDLQVYQQDAFFTSDRQPPPRYSFREFRGRQYAVAGRPCFQVPDDKANSPTRLKRLATQLRKLSNRVVRNGKVL
jgi:phytanoyl-CoA hydroxylase